MIYSIKIIVRGKVQGVWFRKGTQNEARSLGLFGVVQNLKDGSVSIQVSGEKKKVLMLLDWCKTGTIHSIVDSISFEEIESMAYKTFEIIR